MESGNGEFGRAKELIGIRIRELRLAKGISQEKLADLAGCDRTYVGMLDRKLTNPSLRVLARIAEALEVPLHELVAPATSP